MQNLILEITAYFSSKSSIIISALLFCGYTFNANAAFTTPTKKIVNSQSETFVYHELKAAPNTNHPKPHVILLGGGPGFSSWNLEPIQKLLQKLGHNTYLMDMRGIGENASLPISAKNQSITEQWVQDIHNLVMHLDSSNTSKPILIGHSWGALMAMLYTREFPNKVSQLLLLNPVDPEKNAMRDLTENIHQKNQQLQNTTWDDESAWDNEISNLSSEEQARKITELQITQVLPTYFYDYQQGQDYAKLFDYTDFNIDLNVNAWKAYDANPVTYDQIRRWNLPIDFLDCRQDTLMPENLHALETNQVLRKVIVLDKCSHFPWIEQREAFKDSMRYLLKD